MKKLLTIGFIWFGCAVAWVVLGSTVVARSGQIGESLSSDVRLLWGAQGNQLSPTATYTEVRTEKTTVTTTDDKGQQVSHDVDKRVSVQVPVPLDGTDAHAALRLEQRQKGLLWFSTYTVDFKAAYMFANPRAEPTVIAFNFPLEQSQAIFDGFQVKDEKGVARQASFGPGGATWSDEIAPHGQRTFTVSYRSRGTDAWRYRMTSGTDQVKNFKLALDTDFSEVNFPSGSLSPSSQESGAHRWSGVWQFTSLVANGAIGLELPKRLNPGDIAARITFFAPVGLLFFFFVVAILSTAQRRQVHPLNYFMFGCAFFAFHLLFAYLVDQFSLGISFAAASVVSIVLVVSYARLFVGWRFALVEMGLSQLIYLVLFSFTFFWAGFTGLAITVGAIVTLFAIMQITGRVAWNEVVESPGKPAVMG